MNRQFFGIHRGITTSLILRELKKGAGKILGIVVLMALGTAIGVVSPLLFRLMVDRAIPRADARLAAIALLGLVTLPILSTVLTSWQGYVRADLGERVSRALREALFDHVACVKLGEWESVDSEEIAHSLLNDGGELGQVFIASQLLNMISNLILLAGTLLTMWFLNWQLLLVTLLAFPPSILFTNRLRVYSKNLDEELREVVKSGRSFVDEFVTGIRTVRAFRGEALEQQNWRGWNLRFWQIRARTILFHNLMRAMPTEVLNNVVTGLVFGVGAYEVIHRSLSIGSLVAFVAFIPRVYAAMRALLDAQIDTTHANALIEHMDALFRLELEETGTGPAARTPPGDSRGVGIEFRDVAFRHARGDFQVEALSFRIQPGEFVGIVGSTGSGKSTIIDLLMGFYPPQSGSIVIDGKVLTEWSLASLRASVGYVTQHVFLWSRSLRENICYPHSDISDEAIATSAVIGQIDAFIAALPEQYETVLGVNGASLSGGERQRIAISRAIVRNPRLLLLDEATSALDALTEVRVRDAIEASDGQRTTIVVAHRLATVIHADKIIVIEGGTVVEIGAPQDLLAARRRFYDLYQAQRLDIPASEVV